MTLNRWQDTVVNLFAEIAILEMLVKTRINDRRPAGLNENHFAMLNHLVRANGRGDSRTAFAWSFEGMCDNIDGEIDTLASNNLISIQPDSANNDQDHVMLTTEGHAAYTSAIKTLSPDFESLLSGITIEELDSTMVILREIRRTLDNLPNE